MKKLGIFLIFLLLINFLAISLIHAETAPGIPSILTPEETEKTIADLKNKSLTKWDYLGQNWQVMLLKNKVVASLDSFFTKISIIFVILFGMPYSLSITLLVIILLWIFFFFKFGEIFKDFSAFSEGTSWFIALGLTIILAQLQILKKITQFLGWLLFVNKASEEGGDFMGTPEARVEFLLEALERGADYVDVALSTDPKLIKKLVQQRDAKEPKAKLILSYHNFKETPPVEDLQKIVQDAHKQGADMVKIATFIKNVSENVVLLDLLKWATETKIPLIVIGMGDKGNLTRVIAPLLGSPLYYAPMDEDTATAPGQLTKMDLDSIWGHLNS